MQERCQTMQGRERLQVGWGSDQNLSELGMRGARNKGSGTRTVKWCLEGSQKPARDASRSEQWVRSRLSFCH